MSRGGRWKTTIPNAQSPKRGRWATQAGLTASNSSLNADVEMVEESMFDWAINQFLNGKTKEWPNEGTFDFSSLSHEEKMERAFLDAVFWDGGMQHFERIESKVARNAIAWAATQGWPHILSVFNRLLEVMTDVMDRASAGDDPRELKAAGWFASKLAGLARVFAKYESGEWQPEKLDKVIAGWLGKPEETGLPVGHIDRLWMNPLFQQARASMKGGRRISSPQARFAEFVVGIIIGHKEANARINQRKLMLYGVEWMKPKSQDEFDGLREVLMRASFEHLDVLATYLEEGGQEGAALKVRGLKSMGKYRTYWRERQLDEAFRTYFGLMKPRKKLPAKKTPKARKTKASSHR